MKTLQIVKKITYKEDSLDKYLQEVAREKLITPEEECELARRIKKGDQTAVDKLTKANLRFVVSVAKQYQHQGLSLSDLVNEGNLGLIKATKKFDETRGFKFISYAVFWIRQSILQAITEQLRIVRLPLDKVGSLNKINRAYSKFEQEHERGPLPEELSELLGIPSNKIEDYAQISIKHISIDAPLLNGEDSLLDIVSNNDSPNVDEGLIHEGLSYEIDRLLGTLSDREEDVIRMSFGIGCQEITMDEIAVLLKIGSERVRQLKIAIIKKLAYRAKRIMANSLKPYLCNS